MFKESGRINYLGPVRTGFSTKTQKEWAMQDVVLTVSERYPRQVVGTIRRKAFIDIANLKLGEQVEVMFEPSAHEYNGVWYAELTIVDVLQNGISRFVQQPLVQG